MLPGIIPSLVVGSSFPIILGMATTVITTASTTHNINLPAGVQPGDLLIAFMGHVGTSTMPGWTPLDTTTAQFRIATGSDPVAVTISTSSMLHAITYRIKNYAAPPFATSNVGPTGTVHDGPLLMPPWGNSNHLWFSSITSNNGGLTVSSIPPNYADFTYLQSPAGTNACVGVSYRKFKSSMEDPGTFTVSASVGARIRTTAVPGYPVDNMVFKSRSVRFYSGEPSYMTRSVVAGTSRRKGAYSVWIKRSRFDTGASQFLLEAFYDANNRTNFQIQADDKLAMYSITGGASNGYAYSNATFRNAAVWTHIEWRWDTTVGANNMSLTVNGVNSPLTFNVTIPQNTDLWFGAGGVTLQNGRYGGGGSNHFDGYKYDEYLTDGQALSPFGQFNATTSVWEPIPYAGTYGASGGHWNFADYTNVGATGLGKDISGNGNNFTPSIGFSTAGRTNDITVDTPVLPVAEAGIDLGGGEEYRSNYITLNPLDMSTYWAMDDGAIVGRSTNGTIWASSRATRYVSSGKWYCEIQPSNTPPGQALIGILGPATTLVGSGENQQYVGMQADGYGYHPNGTKYNNSNPLAYGAAYTSEDIIGIALDMDAKTVTFYKNGVSQGVAYSGLTGSFAPTASLIGGGYCFFNAGQRRLAYPAPPGFKLMYAANP